MFSGVMQYLPGPQHEAFKHLTGLEEFITRKAQAHQETLDPNCPRDYIDCFLVKMQQVKIPHGVPATVLGPSGGDGHFLLSNC